MRIPLLLLTTLLCCTHAVRNRLTTDVAAFVAKYRQMNETTDVLGSLERIGEDSRELFRLGLPAGKLMATYNASGKVTDEEKTALTELHKLFNYTFDRDTASLFGQTVTLYYQTDAIRFPTYLETVRTFMAALTNSSRSEDGKIFNLATLKEMRAKKGLMAYYDPLTYLSEKLDSQVRLGCRMPTKQGIQTLSKLQDTIRDVESRARGKWNASEFSAVDSYKTGLFHLITTQQDEDHAEQLTKNITELKNIEFENVMDTLRNSHMALMSKSDVFSYYNMKCLLETTIDTSAFNQTLLQLKLEYLYRDLIQIQLLEWALSSVSEQDEKYYFKDAEIAALLVDRTGHFLADWTRTVQEISWPEIGTEFVKRAIELKDIKNITHDQTAMRVQKAFEVHGSPSYYYQVLVVPTSEVGISWSVGSTRIEDYTNITNFHGLDIHVFRFNKTEVVSRSVRAQNWIDKNEQAIKKNIKYGALLSASALLSNLQSKSTAAPLYRNDLFRSVLLLKADKYSPVSFVSSEKDSHSFQTTHTSYSVVNRGKITTTTWNAFFFV